MQNIEITPLDRAEGLKAVGDVGNLVAEAALRAEVIIGRAKKADAQRGGPNRGNPRTARLARGFGVGGH